MSSSPFSNVEAFHSAIEGPTEGAIYTFAQAPAINTIALLLAIVLFVWFMGQLGHKSRKQPAFNKSFITLSLLLVTGLLATVKMSAQQESDNQATSSSAVPSQDVASQQ